MALKDTAIRMAPVAPGDGSAWFSPLRKMLNKICQQGIKPRGIIDEQCLSRIVELFDVRRASLRRSALQGFVGVALRPWIQRDHMIVLGKILELGFPDPAGRAPARFPEAG